MREGDFEEESSGTMMVGMVLCAAGEPPFFVATTRPGEMVGLRYGWRVCVGAGCGEPTCGD